MIVLVHFGPNLTTFLQLSNNASPMSHINHRTLITSIKKKLFCGAKNELFKVNKDHEVRGQVSTTFSESPASGLTVGEKIIVVVRLKLALFQF